MPRPGLESCSPGYESTSYSTHGAIELLVPQCRTIVSYTYHYYISTLSYQCFTVSVLALILICFFVKVLIEMDVNIDKKKTKKTLMLIEVYMSPDGVTHFARDQM